MVFYLIITIYSSIIANAKTCYNLVNDIIKGTKSVLANKVKFKEYIKNYSKTTEKYIFKTPGI